MKAGFGVPEADRDEEQDALQEDRILFEVEESWVRGVMSHVSSSISGPKVLGYFKGPYEVEGPPGSLAWQSLRILLVGFAYR